MRKVVFVILFLFISFIGDALFAQSTLNVHGLVKDKNNVPMAGVTVLIDGTKIGVSTDYDGTYKISVKKGQILKFYFIGFETYSVKVEKEEYNVVLKEENESLEQVVVTGYSQVELRKSTGAVAVVDSKSLTDAPLKKLDQLLQGKLAGIVVSPSSGRPGAAAKVRIRGANTITGNADPLWVVDGVPLQKNIPQINSSQVKAGDFDNIFATGIGSINPNDIESITVLKDAASAAIYGSQAAGGVIVVTTKSGKAGKPRISYNANFSLQTRPYRDANLMNATEKLDWEQQLWNEYSKTAFESGLSGEKQYFPRIGIIGQIRSGYGRFVNMTKQEQDAEIARLASQSTDWFDVLFRNSFSQSHYLSISGGTDNISYYVSGGLNRNNGIVLRTSADSYNFNTKLGLRPFAWMKFDIQADYNYQQSLGSSNNVNMFKYAYFANPYEHLYNEDGSYRADETYFTMPVANGSNLIILPDNGFNIMREINETDSNANSSAFNLRAITTINLLNNLNFSGLASFSYISDASENINGKDTYAAWQDRPFEENAVISKRRYGSISQFSSKNMSYLLRGQLNYSKTFFEQHNLSAILGSEIRSSFASSIFTKRYGYDPITGNYSTPLYSVTSNKGLDETLQMFGSIVDALAGQNKVEDAFASFYGTANYNYASKYIASLTLRSDGSNNFGSNQQFNLNWSLSGAWNIDAESWMQEYKNIVSSLSLRTGFGYTGGVNKSVYPVLIMNYLTQLRKSDEDYYRMGKISNAPNPNLRWEKNRTFNVGLNFGILKDRFTGEISYYHNKNLDQVTSAKIASSTGFTRQSFNTSEQINRGVELTLGASLLKIKDFAWRVTANLSYNYNELTKYDSPNGSIVGETNYAVGYPLNKVFTGIPLGINKSTGMYEFKLRPDAIIQDIEDYKKYQNYLYYVGVSTAPYNGGFSTSFSYKNFSVNLVGNYAIGNKILDNIKPPVDGSSLATVNEVVTPGLNDLYAHYVNVRKDVVNRWTESNPITNAYPRLIDPFAAKLLDAEGHLLSEKRITSDIITNSVLLQDVSYFKLSSLSISYSLPHNWVKSMKLSDINIGVLMNNLYVFTNYKGIDPETPGAVYPQARSFSFNISINF